MSGTEAGNPGIWATLTEAIDAKEEVEIEYEQEESAAGTRRTAPHAIFRGGEGRVFLYAMQLSGASNREGLPGWRRFALESITRATARDTVFAVSESYDPAARMFREGLIKSVS